MRYPVFQTAYVTADLDGAVEAFRDTHGIDAFLINRGVEIETVSGAAHCHFALAFLGDLQIELIEPAGGADAIYRDAICPSSVTIFHHLGFLVPDEAAWRETLRELEATGRPIPVRGGFGGLMHYAYLDRRDLLGHYLEYMFAPPAGASLFANVPRFGAGQPTAAIL